VRGGTTLEPIPVTRSVFKKVVKERRRCWPPTPRPTWVLRCRSWRPRSCPPSACRSGRARTSWACCRWTTARSQRDLQGEGSRPAHAHRAERQPWGGARAHAGQAARAEERQRTENTYLKSREKTRRFEGMIGESAAIQRLTSQLRKVVDTRVTCSSRARPAPARSSWRAPCTTGPTARTACSWRRTARPCPRTCWRASSSGTRRARSPGPPKTRRASSSWPTWARSSSTRWARCRCRCRPSCCACCKRVKCGPWAATPPARWTCASWRHQPHARERGARGALPRGPLLPSAGVPAPAAAAA
jgi:hypothetical protein